MRRTHRWARSARRWVAALLLPGVLPAALAAQEAAPDTARVENRASLSYSMETGLVETAVASVSVLVESGRLELAKQLLGGDSIRVGSEARFRIAYRNPSAVPLHAVEVVDTLSPALELVSAEGDPEVSGRAITWRLDSLAPGAEGAWEIVVRAVSVPAAGDAVVNRVFGRGAGAVDEVAAAAPLAVAPALEPGALRLAKQAHLLEAGVGDLVPYSLVVGNHGGAVLRGVVVTDRLPEGTRLATETVAGTDSVRVAGGEVHLHLSGALEPGAERTLRYSLAIVSPGDAGTLSNRAWAEAEGGALRSDTATAWVRMRRGSALQTRTLVGKVWLDEDGDGRQDGGERGAAGVRVWSADGEVVTTDAEGRFSFRNLRPGAHLYRVDPQDLPEGYVVPGREESTRSVRADGWTVPRVAFRLVPTAPALGPGEGDGGVRGPGAAPVLRAPRVPPLRSVEERREELDSEFLLGPAVRIASPVDGTVIGTNRLYVGVRGEPGAEVRLYDGDRVVSEATLRPDGVHDFIGVELAPGPHRLRVWMRNSWGQERWDSASVHRSGEPERIEVAAEELELRVDTRAEPLRLRLLDRWGVPVADTPTVTVRASGARVQGPDRDGGSLHHQVRARADGSAEVRLRGGDTIRAGELSLEAGRARARVPLRVLPQLRPLIATGMAQVGVGNAPAALGALTLRGTLGRETAVTLSYDSRRADPRDDFFGRGHDPLEETLYPAYGDGSERTVLSSATQTLSARVERGYSWMELGDVTTQGFGREGSLGSYRRSLTGVQGRVSAGALSWQGFGSVTDQQLDQRQLRGDGSSGPYRIGAAVRPGTERVAVEVRAAENAARVLARQELVRFVDYQLDYLTGELLLNRPVPAADAQGNPVFVVATVERRSGGEAQLVGGLRVELDAARLLPAGGPDSLAVAVFGVHEADAADAADAGGDLVGTELRMAHRGVEAGVELVRGMRPDSIAQAVRLEAAWTLPGRRVRLDAGWLQVGDGFSATMNPRLASELSEIRLGGELRLPLGTSLRVRHERQHFQQYGVRRENTLVRLERSVGARRMAAEGGLTSDLQLGSDAWSSAALVRASYGATERLEFWMEGTHALSTPVGLPGRPDHVGGGASYRVLDAVRLEGSHRWVVPQGDSAAFAVSSVGVRGERVLGGEAWGGVERAQGETATHSAVLGWSQRLSARGGWAFSTMLERRIGLSRAPLADPSRALPFAQPEQDRWSGGMGVEWLPADSAARFSARTELRRGRDRAGYRLDLAGDLPLGPSMALLTRHDWSGDRWAAGGQGSRRDRSLLGFAFRPVGSDAVNLLTKLEWRRTEGTGGLGQALSQVRDETRLIGSTDVVWSVDRRSEVAGRYAVRQVLATDSASAGLASRSLAHYLGSRLEREVHGPLSARLDARLLLVGTAHAPAWSLAPALALKIGPALELEAGYSFGDLQDPDFFARGHGFAATLGFRFTEQSLGDVTSFWRRRMAQGEWATAERPSPAAPVPAPTPPVAAPRPAPLPAPATPDAPATEPRPLPAPPAEPAAPIAAPILPVVPTVRTPAAAPPAPVPPALLAQAPAEPATSEPATPAAAEPVVRTQPVAPRPAPRTGSDWPRLCPTSPAHDGGAARGCILPFSGDDLPGWPTRGPLRWIWLVALPYARRRYYPGEEKGR